MRRALVIHACIKWTSLALLGSSIGVWAFAHVRQPGWTENHGNSLDITPLLPFVYHLPFWVPVLACALVSFVSWFWWGDMPPKEGPPASR